MSPHPYVVVADYIKGFDTIEDARAYAMRNHPAVICIPVPDGAGGRTLREIQRYDLLYDDTRHEWRVMFSQVLGVNVP
jgi:hypothetical protein